MRSQPREPAIGAGKRDAPAYDAAIGAMLDEERLFATFNVPGQRPIDEDSPSRGALHMQNAARRERRAHAQSHHVWFCAVAPHVDAGMTMCTKLQQRGTRTNEALLPCPQNARFVDNPPRSAKS